MKHWLARKLRQFAQWLSWVPEPEPAPPSRALEGEDRDTAWRLVVWLVALEAYLQGGALRGKSQIPFNESDIGSQIFSVYTREMRNQELANYCSNVTRQIHIANLLHRLTP